MNETDFRIVSPEDAEEILGIYAPYIEKTAITFEYTVPSVKEFRERIVKTLKKYPYIKAVREGRIIGYAYTGTFKDRAAYDWSVETSIYLAMGERGNGVGTRLYEILEALSKAQNVLNMNACITYPKDGEDQYVSMASPQFHKALGYSHVGRFHDSGYKFGTWYDMIWMEKMLGQHTSDPAPFTPFPELSSEALRSAGISLF